MITMENDAFEFVQRSQYRQKVLKAMNGQVLMPKEIAEKSGIKINHISKVLSELKNKGLVELINPEVRKGRLYRLTKKGEIIIDNI